MYAGRLLFLTDSLLYWSKPHIKVIHFHQRVTGWNVLQFQLPVDLLRRARGRWPIGNPGQCGIDDRGGAINEKLQLCVM